MADIFEHFWRLVKLLMLLATLKSQVYYPNCPYIKPNMRYVKAYPIVASHSGVPSAPRERKRGSRRISTPAKQCVFSATPRTSKLLRTSIEHPTTPSPIKHICTRCVHDRGSRDRLACRRIWLPGIPDESIRHACKGLPLRAQCESGTGGGPAGCRQGAPAQVGPLQREPRIPGPAR